MSNNDTNIKENDSEFDYHGYAEDMRVLEALLFASKEPVSMAKLAEHVEDSKKESLSDILEMIKYHYEKRGINLYCRDGAWAFRTAPDLAGRLRIEKEVPKKLSRAALETLAIIAYHQPVTRAEIENIRGVSISKGTLDILIEIGWIKPGRRRQVPGRPLTWVTTLKFLDHFDLGSMEDLPGVQEMKDAGLLDKRPAIDALPQSDMFAELEENETNEDGNKIHEE